MIVTIDGPCGSGKSTVAKALARHLGYEYLDTGAMYRTVTWKALEDGLDLDYGHDRIIDIAKNIRIKFRNDEDSFRVICDGKDITSEIRTPEVTCKIKAVADIPHVRTAMIRLQRRYALQARKIVTEGRDQGSEVFPDADLKFYLDAELETRARRRLSDFHNQNIACDLKEVVQDICERDRADRERPVGGLRHTDCMITVDSTDMSVDEVVLYMASIVRGKLSETAES